MRARVRAGRTCTSISGRIQSIRPVSSADDWLLSPREPPRSPRADRVPIVRRKDRARARGPTDKARDHASPRDVNRHVIMSSTLDVAARGGIRMLSVRQSRLRSWRIKLDDSVRLDPALWRRKHVRVGNVRGKADIKHTHTHIRCKIQNPCNLFRIKYLYI